METAWQHVLAWLAEHGAYFLTLSSNTPVALTWFCAGVLVWLLWRGYWARRKIDQARRKLPLNSFSDADQAILTGFQRQALHAAALGFTHPVTEEVLQFTAEMPDDMKILRKTLKNPL